MASGAEDMPYTTLRVVKPMTISAGPAAAVPEFGVEGGGMQYLFNGVSNRGLIVVTCR
jgi:hypothetical protein